MITIIILCLILGLLLSKQFKEKSQSSCSELSKLYSLNGSPCMVNMYNIHVHSLDTRLGRLLWGYSSLKTETMYIPITYNSAVTMLCIMCSACSFCNMDNKTCVQIFFFTRVLFLLHSCESRDPTIILHFNVYTGYYTKCSAKETHHPQHNITVTRQFVP